MWQLLVAVAPLLLQHHVSSDCEVRVNPNMDSSSDYITQTSHNYQNVEKNCESNNTSNNYNF
jgi:hypothetical protein